MRTLKFLSNSLTTKAPINVCSTYIPMQNISCNKIEKDTKIQYYLQTKKIACRLLMCKSSAVRHIVKSITSPNL